MLHIDNPCDYELTRREFGCITPHAGWHAKQPNATDSEVQSWKANSFGYTAVCGLVNSRDQDKQCCMGDMCNDKLTMEKEQNYIEKCVTPLHVKVLIAVLSLLGLFVLFGVVIFLIKPSWIKSLCQVSEVILYSSNRNRFLFHSTSQQNPCRQKPTKKTPYTVTHHREIVEMMAQTIVSTRRIPP